MLLRLGMAAQLIEHGPLCIEDAPIGIIGRRPGRGILIDEGARIERFEQAGAFEVSRHHLRDVAAELLPLIAPDEIGNRDRHRLDLAMSDVEMEFGPRGRSGDGDAEGDQGGEGCVGESDHPAISLGSKVMVKVCH